MSAPSSPPLQKKKSASLLWLWILLALLIGAGIWLWVRYDRRYVSTNDAFIDTFVVQVSPELLLKLETLYVDEGDTVQAGQLLCQLDTSVLMPQQQAAIAEFNAATARINLNRVLRARAWDDYQRGIRGFATNIVSVQDFDHLKKAYEAADQEVILAEMEQVLAQEKVNVATAYLEKTRLCSPVQGMIAKRWSMEGDVLSPGQPIFSLYDANALWVTAYLQETDIAKVRLGDSVDISVDAYPNKKFKGYVYTIQGAAAGQFSLIPPNNATGNYTKVAQRIPLKISVFPESDSHHPLYLFAGMSCEITIHVAH